MSGPDIGAARAGEVAALGRILSDWIDETPWMPRLHSREEDRAFVADLIRTGGVSVARAGETPLGFLFEEGGLLGAFYLVREMRGQGIGKRLLDAVKADHGRVDLWTFEANQGAVRFYAREGFVEVERTRGDNAERLADVRMRWQREG